MTPKEIVWLTVALVAMTWLGIAITQFFVWAVFGTLFITTAHPIFFWFGSIIVAAILLEILHKTI